jgi:hypothetical protein
MMRRNDSVLPVSCEVPPNGLYEAYRYLLDQIFVQTEFDKDQLRHLYIFDRAQYVGERFRPRGWQRVEVVEDPVLLKDFEIRPEFGEYEREFLSFLRVDLRGKLLRIVGEPGTGKSTFLRFMLDSYLPQQRFFGSGRLISLDLSKVLRVHDRYEYDQTADLLISNLVSSLLKTDAPPRGCAGWSHQDLVDWVRQEVEERGPARVLVAFDNVDVFDAGFQESLWRISESLARSTGCTVILCMRPINSRYFTACGVAGNSVRYDMWQRPPVLHSVIQRRLEYFLEANEDFKPNRLLRIAAREFWVTFSDMRSFIERFLDMLLDNRIQNALDNLSNYNVKLALLWTLRFISSWNLNVPLLLGRLIRATGLEMPSEGADEFDTFIVALGLGNYSMYFPRSSCLENLFSAHIRGRESDLLIKYRILKYCSGSSAPVRKDELVEHLRRFGYDSGEIVRAVSLLVAPPRRLLRSMDGEEFQEMRTLEPTHSGKYYLHRLIYYLKYVQIVADDIDIPEDLSHAMTMDRSIYERMGATLRFIDLIGNREFDEANRFISSGGDSCKLSRHYASIYGTRPLCVEMVDSARASMMSIYARLHYPASSKEKDALCEEADRIASEFRDRFAGLLCHRE